MTTKVNKRELNVSIDFYLVRKALNVEERKKCPILSSGC